jgi:hypothetical protein
MGGRRVPVTRPRVRAADGSGELHLPSYDWRVCSVQVGNAIDLLCTSNLGMICCSAAVWDAGMLGLAIDLDGRRIVRWMPRLGGR